MIMISVITVWTSTWGYVGCIDTSIPALFSNHVLNICICDNQQNNTESGNPLSQLLRSPVNTFSNYQVSHGPLIKEQTLGFFINCILWRQLLYLWFYKGEIPFIGSFLKKFSKSGKIIRIIWKSIFKWIFHFWFLVRTSKMNYCVNKRAHSARAGKSVWQQRRKGIWSVCILNRKTLSKLLIYTNVHRHCVNSWREYCNI